jgi:carboxyl-terminal processing protease
MTPHKKIVPLSLLVLLSLTCYGQIKPLFPVSETQLDSANQVFEEIKDLILSNYYTTDLSESDLYFAAIKGMLRHISPPETPTLATIWTADEYEKILNSLKGVDISIGIKSTFNSRDGSLMVTSIESKSPSEGILYPLDRILRIDGKSLKGISIKEVNKLLNGPEGTEVTLTISRDLEIITQTIERKAFAVSNLEVSTFGNTALIEIHKIYLGLADELEKELKTLETNNVQNVILDLRHNGGGVLNEGVKVANLFLKAKNIIVRTLSRADQTKPIVADRAVPFEFSLVTLIDGNTASAAEIIASALQDQKRAIIVGHKTFGKGVIETTFTLKNEYRVKFITSAMYTPLGKSWQNKGILPDFLVQQADKSYKELTSLPIEDRINKDIYLITANKLLR